MLTKFKTHVTARPTPNKADAGTRTDHSRPSGRLGGPGVPAVRRNDPLLPGVGMDSYSADVPFAQALYRLRRALSQNGFDILRECDVGSRIRPRNESDSATQYRILYVARPELFSTAISTHASVGLWLPIPLVICEREKSVAILLPDDVIVHDRATLLGLRALVQQEYRRLRSAIETLATRDSRKDDVRGAPEDIW